MNRPISLLGLRRDDLRAMTETESEIFVRLSLSPKADQDAATLDSDVFSLGGMAMDMARHAVVARLAKAGVSVTVAALVVICSWTERPGDLVLFAYTALEIARREGTSVVTLAHLSEPDSFGWGVPTKAARNRVWDAQKHFDGADDNWLDTDAAWTLEAVPA